MLIRAMPFLVSLFLLNSSSLAESVPPDVRVLPLNPYLALPDAKPRARMTKEAAAEPKLPSPRERDLIFRQAGIVNEVKTWDQLRKDLLVIHAESQSNRELEKNYSQIAPAKLAKLSEKIRNYFRQNRNISSQ